MTVQQPAAGRRETTLGEVIELVGGGTPKTTVQEYWGGNIPWLSVVDFNNGERWVTRTEKTITEKGLKESSTKILNAGDLIISARGTVGALAQLKVDMAFNQSCYGIKEIKNISDEDFLYYLIKDRVSQIGKNVHGAVFDTITKQTFDYISISLPPLPEQIAIASLLSSFDDKIELLREQNRTLESLGQTIFQEWFGKYSVDDPEGLPEGWRVGKLAEVAEEIIRGFTTIYVEKSNLINLNQKVNKGKTLDKQYFKYHPEETIVPQNKFLRKHDILLNSLGEGTLGRIHFYNEETNNVIADQHITILRFKKELSFYIYQSLISQEGNFRLLNGISGSTGMLMLNINMVRDFNIILPSELEIKKYYESAQSLYKKISLNNSQIQSLSSSRDTLLPKLMSGEVRVEDI